MRRREFINDALRAGTAAAASLLGERDSAAGAAAFAPFAPPEGPNKPVGIARGIAPGRVAWAWNPDATSWEGDRGFWWEDACNSQAAIDTMLSLALQSITRTKTDPQAWDALFKDFNRRHGKGRRGYRTGERIAIKFNLNNDHRYEANNNINSSPHVMLALVRQLVGQAGVPQSAVTFYDAVRRITPHTYDKCHGEFPQVSFVDGSGALPGRMKAVFQPDRITYAVQMPRAGKGIAACAVEAAYLINIFIPKGHDVAGVTLSGKNHFGSIDDREHTSINSKARGYGSYNSLVELMGHNDLGGKTMLYIGDMLYGCYHSDPPPVKWKMAPFSDHWPSSLLVSQDGVACDSVALDFLTSEFEPRAATKVDMSVCDNVLHEAALADDPPSKTVYAPNRDGVRLGSLGVHEHWNNSTEKKYTRNLGSGSGIELVFIDSRS
ncbi:MAG: DUF362 domain-containing protein [Bryobacteraceae bacterium]